MARRRDSLAATVIQLPWWVGLVLAAGVYVLLAVVAPLAVPEGNQFAPVMIAAARTWGKVLAILFVILSFGSAIRAFFARRLLDKQSSIESIRSLSWRQFEVLVAEAFRRRGYTVVETGGGGADGGVDVVLRKDGEKYLVQAKHWKARQIGVTTVRELKGVMATTGAAGGFVVSSGTFTHDAQAFADTAGIELIDGPSLTRMIDEVRVNPRKPSTPARAELVVEGAVATECPRCGSPMVKRTAKRGSNAGGQFWGCSAYPRCRTTMAIDPG